MVLEELVELVLARVLALVVEAVVGEVEEEPEEEGEELVDVDAAVLVVVVWRSSVCVHIGSLGGGSLPFLACLGVFFIFMLGYARLS